MVIGIRCARALERDVSECAGVFVCVARAARAVWSLYWPCMGFRWARLAAQGSWLEVNLATVRFVMCDGLVLSASFVCPRPFYSVFCHGLRFVK